MNALIREASLQPVGQASGLPVAGPLAPQANPIREPCVLPVKDSKLLLRRYGRPPALGGRSAVSSSQSGGLPSGSRCVVLGARANDHRASAWKAATLEGGQRERRLMRDPGCGDLPAQALARTVSAFLARPPGCPPLERMSGGRSPRQRGTTTGYRLATLQVAPEANSPEQSPDFGGKPPACRFSGLPAPHMRLKPIIARLRIQGLDTLFVFFGHLHAGFSA